MGRVQLNVWVEEAERDSIKAKAAERGVPVGRLVVEAVLGAVQSPDVALASRASSAVARAEEALERVAGLESSVEDLDRRLRRFEEMTHGQY